MSVSIYAAKVESDEALGLFMGPVIDFKCWDETIWPADTEERFARGEDVDTLPNPDFVPNAGMNLANGNAHTLFSALGLEIHDGYCADFPIDTVQQAVMRLINGNPDAHARPASATTGDQGAQFFDAGVSGDKISLYCARLLGLIIAGRPLGATHIVVA